MMDDYSDVDKLIRDRLVACVRAADGIRAAQVAYMADRGNESKGRAVANAAQIYDDARLALTRTPYAEGVIT